MAQELRPDGKGRLPGQVRERVKRLRTASTDAERRLWYFLRASRFGGVKFRRQHPVAGYVLDFYCHRASLGIELDGGQHAEESQAAQDHEREHTLEALGIRILRFWNHEVLRDTESVLEVIRRAVFDDV